MPTSVFADAMIYLHFNRLDHVPLKSIVGDDEISIVVPRVTIKELDHHKDSHLLQSVRDRARNTLAEIERASEQDGEFYGYPIEVLISWPAIGDERPGLNKDRQDDLFLASVLEYKAREPSKRVLVITDDTGLRLACRHHGIDRIGLEDKYQLPSEADRDVKEIRRLKTENELLKSRIPKLVFGFCSPAGAIDQSKHQLPLHISNPCNIAAIREGLVKRCPSVEKHPALDVETFRAALGSLPEGQTVHDALRSFRLGTVTKHYPQEIADSEFERYEKERVSYLEECERYLEDRAEYDQLLRLTIDLALEIRNVGRGPADDVDLHAHFPDGFVLSEAERFFREPIPPTPPIAPQSQSQKLLAAADFSRRSLIPKLPIFEGLSFDAPSSFRLERTLSYDMSDHFDRVKHGCAMSLPLLKCTFLSIDDLKSFSIDYSISAANLPTAAEGTLHVVVERSSS